MNDILIHTLKALARPQNPDKSRPCQSTDVCDLFFRILFLEFARFLEYTE